MKEEDEIQSLRQKIEQVDDEILRLLNDRAKIVQQIGQIKSKIKMDFYNPRREEEILQRLRALSFGPFPKWAIPYVFREIISACRSLETEMTVAFLGPLATFSHMAGVQYFGSSVQFVPENTIPSVFESVEKGKVDYGVVPIENSTEGPVNPTLDMFIQSEVRICGEIMVRISHDLLSQSGRPEEIQRICSHPQALSQCQGWLKKNYPHIQLEEAASTAKAAQRATEDSEIAAIASSLAAHLYGLKVVASQIEDNPNNYTRFLILGREGVERTGKDKTSILFSISHAPGALCQVLQVFYDQGINLTKIESRPTRGKPWEYLFFIDFEGHVTEANVIEALERMKGQVISMRILGSYPQFIQ